MAGYDYARCTLDDVASALRFISPEDRETWVLMGMAVKSEFGADGFDTWDSWSQQGSTYKPKAARDSWKSFKQGRGVTIATLFKAAIDAGWQLDKKTLTEAEQLQLSRQIEARRLQREKEDAEERAACVKWYAAVAEASLLIWGMLRPEGESEYLTRKQVPPLGIGFVVSRIVVVFDEARQCVNVLTDYEQIQDFWKNKKGDASFRYLKPGEIVVPLFDQFGRLANLQIIYPSGKKAFLKYGPKSGLSYAIGSISLSAPIAFTEGFATAASVHMATGLPVVVALDSGNLPVVARLYRDRYPDNLFIFAGDNDVMTEGNPGLSKAIEAANDVGGVVVVPVFDVAA